MCQKCGNNKCGGGCNTNSVASIQDQINTLSGFVDNLVNITRFLKGHPILEVHNGDDIAEFDLATGKGTGNWTGWGVCNGNTYPGPLGNIVTPDMRDNFLVGALGTYAVGDQGGENTHILTISEMPSHNHTIHDPGHTHVINDPGHDHPVDDPGHTHSATTPAHQHTFTTGTESATHTHRYDKVDLGGSGYKGPQTPVISPSYTFDFATTDTSSESATHTHSGITDNAALAITVSVSFTGIVIDDAFTGISNIPNTTGITIDPNGGGQAHENRPPFLALIFVQKIF